MTTRRRLVRAPNDGRIEHVYAELHCHTWSSFLDGVSPAEELVERACELGYEALAVTDHDGFPAAVRVAQAAAEHGLPVVYGTELTLRPSLPGQAGTDR